MDKRMIQHRDQILDIAKKYRVKNVRIFGSQVRNENTDASDVDFLVEFEQPNLFDSYGDERGIAATTGHPGGFVDG